MRSAKNTLSNLITLIDETQDFDEISTQFSLLATSDRGVFCVSLKHYPAVVGEGRTWKDSFLDMRASAELNLECIDDNQNLKRA